MISVRPDPAHPRGGYAELSLPEAAIADNATQVAVFDNYSERFLGENGWQATKEVFGPYAVTRAGGQARVIIGPEIVNQIEEYASVKIIVEQAEEDISWPDDIVPAPGAARIGGIMTAAPAQKAPQSTLTAKIPAPEIDATASAPEPETPPVAEVALEPARTRRGGMWIGLLLMVLLAAGLAYWFLNADDTPKAEASAQPAVEPSADPCSGGALRALDGFAAQASALISCGGKADADTALGLVEQAAATDDAQALLLFGMIYDGQSDADVIEDQIGLTFDDVPATAAEYYARAAAAGSVEASERLSGLCERMAEMTDTLSQGAVEDYCGN